MRNISRWICAAALMPAVFVISASSGLAATTTMDCSKNQLTRTFGGSQWLILGCGNNRNILIIQPAPGNPAGASFLVFPNAQVNRLNGAQPGDKATEDAAYQDIQKLTPSDVAALIEAVRAQ